MKHTFFFLMLCLLFACSERRDYIAALEQAREVINDYPDSALRILDSLGKHEAEFGKHFTMQYRLNRLNVYNKLDTVFHSTDEAQALADYFEDYGDANDQLLAYYLLGRAYSDIHEAPMAMKYFQVAIDHADTTSHDCDFAQLSRVYGQMGNIFYQQNLMENSLYCRDEAVKYGWLAKDTLCILTNLSSKIYSLSRMLNTDTIITITANVSRQAREFGYNKIAAGILGNAIRQLAEKGDYSKAKTYMDIYELESGFFNDSNNIEKGRESYYFNKGTYYMGVGKIDSAKFYFYKELHEGKDFNNQNAASHGLALLFQRAGQPDSAAKYALYSYDMNDSLYAHMATKDVEQMKALYDYTRNQMIAQKERERAKAEQDKTKAIIGISLIPLFLATYIVWRIYRKREEERLKYKESVYSLAKTQSELLKLRSYKVEQEEQLNQLILEKEKDVAKLNQEIESYKEKVKIHIDQVEIALQKSDTYKQLQKIAGKAIYITDEEWHQVYMMTIEILPSFYELMSSKRLEINDKEFKTCILIRLHFTPKEIANMLGVSSAYITKIRNQMMIKLFGVEGKSKELDEKLMELS